MLKKSFSPTTRPLAASALAMFLAVPMSVSAASFNISTAVPSSQTLSGTETGTVTSTGSISVPWSSAILINTGATGNVSNAGTISSAPSGNWASGINATGTWGGSLTNSGTINAATNNWSARATGVYVDTWNNANALNNSGTISASAVGTSSTAQANGVSGITLNGSLTNSGTIDAVANASWSAAANGVSFTTMTGTLNNSGTISANATSVTSSAAAFGVNLGTMDGTITNSGTITATAASTAQGVTIGTMNNSLTNSGTISAMASSGIARAISLGSMTGTITNSGTISATDNGLWGRANGIRVSGTLTGDIVNNTGAIISAAAASTASAIDVWNMQGNITNNGTISASGSGAAVRVSGGMSGNINNSGTISSTWGDGIQITNGASMATASTTAATIYALNGSITNSGTITAGSDGILINGNLVGNITNSGTISASRTGIAINGDVHGNITNSGTIETLLRDGIALNNLAGTLTNSGSIVSGSDAIGVGRIEAGSSVINSGSIVSGSYGIYNWGGNAGTISNSGTIGGTGAYGIFSSSNLAGDTGTITNSGIINSTGNAAIHVSGAAGYTYTITNSGIINATSAANAVEGWGAANGTLTNTGTINGSVAMGSGDDTVNINGGIINGTISGGLNTLAGADTLNFNTAGYALQGNVDGFEQVNFNKGMTDLNGFVVASGSSATIAAGAGVVMNSGVIEASVTNNGTLDAGAGISVIWGNYTQAAGSTTQIDIYSSTSSSVLGVAGVATLRNVEAHVAGTDYVADGSSYIAMETLTGFDTTNLKLTDNSAVLDFTADTTTNPAQMLLTANRVATYQSLAGSSYANLAGKLDTIGASGIYTAEQMAILGALDASPTGTAVAQKLADLSPDATGAELEGSRSVTNTVGNVIGQRIDSQLASAGHGTGMAAGDAFRDSGIWLQGFFGSATQDGTLGNNGYDASNSGFVIGGDTSVTANARVGLSLASTKNKIDLVNGATPDKLDIDSTHVTVYGSYEANSWNLAGMLASSSHDYDSTRNGINKASYSGSQLTMKVQGGFPMEMGGMKLTPVASFSHSTLDLDGYTETGAGGLTVRSSSYDSNELGVGALLAKEIKGGSLTWVPRASLRYRHEMGDVKQETNATLNTAGISFSTNSVERSRGTVELGLGVDMLSGERFALQADYQLDSRGDYSANTGRLSVRYKF